MLGENGAIAGAQPGTLFIDFSTVDPSAVREMADTCLEKECRFLEAPVSGGVKGAKTGTLTIMIGGDEADFERAQPILKIVGENAFRVGPVGSASTVKLINQMLVGVHLAAALQAFVVAQRAGIDPEVLLDILMASTGDSAMLRRGARNLFADDFAPGFKMELLLKDLRLATELGEELDVPFTLAAAAEHVYESARATGLGDRDITAAVLAMPWRRVEHESPGRTVMATANQQEHAGAVEELVAALAQQAPTTVYEASGKKGAMDASLHPVAPGMRLCGRALTVRCQPADNLTLHAAVARAKPGDVIVADVAGFVEAGHWGEILTVAAQQRGVAGLVINGGVRDIDAARRRDLPGLRRRRLDEGDSQRGAGIDQRTDRLRRRRGASR